MNKLTFKRVWDAAWEAGFVACDLRVSDGEATEDPDRNNEERDNDFNRWFKRTQSEEI